ncbi:MAG: M48 family metalloprotease, partial [Nanopusillaceae archaeon]
MIIFNSTLKKGINNISWSDVAEYLIIYVVLYVIFLFLTRYTIVYFVLENPSIFNMLINDPGIKLFPNNPILGWIIIPTLLSFIYFILITVFVSFIVYYPLLKNTEKEIKQNIGLFIKNILLAKEPTTDQEKQAERIIKTVGIAFGIPEYKVKVYILPWTEINAFVAEDDNYVYFGITSGAINNLDYYELQSLAGHEFAHVYNKDTKIMTEVGISNSLSILLSWVLMTIIPYILADYGFLSKPSDEKNIGKDIANKMLYHFVSGKRKEKSLTNIIIANIAMFVGILGHTYSLSKFRKLASELSQDRELLADLQSSYVTKYPEGLVRVLSKAGLLIIKEGKVNNYKKQVVEKKIGFFDILKE